MVATDSRVCFASCFIRATDGTVLLSNDQRLSGQVMVGILRAAMLFSEYAAGEGHHQMQWKSYYIKTLQPMCPATSCSCPLLSQTTSGPLTMAVADGRDFRRLIQ
jgi:hypothetical protein